MRCCSMPTPARSRRLAASPGAASTTTCAPQWTRCSAASSAPSTRDSRPCAATTCSTPTSATSPRAGRRGWSATPHPIHRQFTVAEMWELEKPHLMSMPAPFNGYVELLARVSSTCLVAAARNRYSVPCEWAGHIVSTRVYPERIDVATADAVVASHARLPGSGQTSYDWQHYIDLVQRKPGALRNGTPFLDLPAPLLRLRQSLLRHPGGDRVMAQVLAVVPQAGLEAVLVAVELVLEGRAPSGSISVEHVRNVLARLNSPATPDQAQTPLRLTQAPKADTARYDRLRPTHQDHLDGQEVGHA